jgi:hypothetical protein
VSRFSIENSKIPIPPKVFSVALNNCAGCEATLKHRNRFNLPVITLCHRQFHRNLFFHCFANFFLVSFLFLPCSTDDSYKRRAIEISHSYRNRDQDPLKKAVFWVEYVAKNGASLLRSEAGVKLNPLNYHSLDVLAVLLCSMTVTILLVIKVITSLWRGIRSAMRGEKLPVGASKKHN